jgi:hypothetical protein
MRCGHWHKGHPSGSTLPHAAAPVQHLPQALAAELRAALAGGRGALRAPHALGHGGAAVGGAGAGTAGGAARKCRLHFLSARQPASGRPYYAQDLMIDPRGLLNYWRSGGENLLPIPAQWRVNPLAVDELFGFLCCHTLRNDMPIPPFGINSSPWS